MVRKTNFLSFSVLVSELVTFMSKKKVLYEFPPKFQNHRKAYFRRVWLALWRNIFLLIYIPFYWFDQKKLFKTNPNFTQDLPLPNMVRKTNFLSTSVLVSEIVTFMSKKKRSLWISAKMLQKKRNHSLAVCVSICGVKQFL